MKLWKPTSRPPRAISRRGFLWNGSTGLASVLLAPGLAGLAIQRSRGAEEPAMGMQAPAGSGGTAPAPSGRARWFLKSRVGPDGTYAPDQIIKAAQVRHSQEGQLAARAGIAFRPPGGAGSVNWTPLGPSAILYGGATGNPIVSGRITGLAAGPDGRVYAGAANGGVWFSGDSGTTWEPLDEWFWKAPSPPPSGTADSLSVGAVAVKFGQTRQSDILFVGTGEANSADNAYFGVGIRLSSNGGQSFTLEATNLAGKGIYNIAIDPDASDPIALAATTAGLYRRPQSGNSRDTWEAKKIADAATDVIVVGTGANKTYYAAFQTADANKIYSSTDNGVTWSGIGGINSPKGRIALAGSESSPSVVYALAIDAAGEPVLFRRDGSNDFKLVSFPTKSGSDTDIHNLFGIKAHQGDYDIAVAIDPQDANRVYLAGSDIFDQGSWNLALFDCLVDATTNPAAPSLTATFIGTKIHPMPTAWRSKPKAAGCTIGRSSGSAQTAVRSARPRLGRRERSSRAATA